MSTIIINRTEFVNVNILPRIDSLARERSYARSDVVRDILYSSFKYPTTQRSPEQLEEIYSEEASIESTWEKQMCGSLR